MTINENDEYTYRAKYFALKAMVEKLDSREPDTDGYVTHLPELQEILSQLSPNVAVSIVESRSSVTSDKDISVMVKVRFTLEREALER